MAIWGLRPDWDVSISTERKLATIRAAMDSLVTVDELREALENVKPLTASGYRRTKNAKMESADAVAF
jgi:hypothetical protein